MIAKKELLRYDANRKCAKCGYGASTTFNGIGSITRRCGRCDYIWFEETLDSPRSAEKQSAKGETNA